MKLILHIDMDSYFVSAHRTVDKFLNNKPVVISMGERRSVITSVSYEAKKYGIRAAMPLHRAKELYKDVITVAPDFSLYVFLSNKLFNLLSSQYTQTIEIASIDECYMDATELLEDYPSVHDLCKDIQERVMNELQLPISIGVGRNKFIAKMSTALNKPYGITITKFDDFPKVFWNMDIGEIYGIGRSSAQKLRDLDIKTIGDLAKCNPEKARVVLGIRTESLIANANGHGSDEIDISMNDLKSIGNSRTYNEDLTDEYEILKKLSNLSSLVALRMNNRNVIADVINVQVKSTGGKEIRAKSKQKKLTRPIKDYDDIQREAKDLLLDLWDGKAIKFLGVTMSNIKNMFDITQQKSIYDMEKAKSKEETLIDDLNSQLKFKGLKLGREVEMDQIKEQKQSKYFESDRLLKNE